MQRPLHTPHSELTDMVHAPDQSPRAMANLAPLPDRTVADLIAEVILRGRSPKTKAAYRADLQDFLVWRVGTTVSVPADLSDLRVSSPVAHALNATLAALQRTSEADINAYRDHLARTLQPSSINRRLTPLRLLFQRLHRYHLIAVNPLEFIRGAKLRNVSATVYLDRHEARTLEDACVGPTLRDMRDRALIVVMLATGLRSTETITLQIDKLGRQGKHTIAWVQGKGGAEERVKLSPHAQRMLAAYLEAAQIGEGAVFRRLRPCHRTPDAPQPYNVHGPLSYTGLHFILTERFAAARLSDKLSPHSLRHTFITLALRGGATLPMVQAAARHASPQTTMRYAHDMDDLDQNAVDYVSW
jgi:integrase/recombinase XerD